MMASTFQRQNGRESALSMLNFAIEALNLAREISSITPATAAFGLVSALLTMVRVRLIPLRGNKFLIHVYLGLHGQQTRLRRAWTILRR